jgi:hypothetical protein
VPNNRYISLRFPVNAEGQRRKTSAINFLLGRDWRVVGETIEPGHMKGDEACCLAMICLPLGFAAGRTDDIVAVSLQYEGDDHAVDPHEHQPVKLDNTPTIICGVCNNSLTDAQVRAIELAERTRAQERAAAERQAVAALTAQRRREEQQRRAERQAYLDAHPEEREQQRRQILMRVGIGVIVCVVVVLGLIILGIIVGHQPHHHR